MLDAREGLIVCKVSGKDAERVFAHESGGHRVQRVSPTEKRGRVHTSTITVVILNELPQIKVNILEKDLEWTTCRSSGAGGQHVNKTSSAVQLKHIPSGISVRVESRSQHQNKQEALSLIKMRLAALEKDKVFSARTTDRKKQAGSGQRGDKIRTIRIQDGIVTDHKTGRRLQYRDYAKAIWDDLLDA